MELIEGVNIGQLPDIFSGLEKKNKILKLKGDDSLSSLNEDYLRFIEEINNDSTRYRDIKIGDVIKGNIILISEKEIIIDINYKDYLYVENKSNRITETLKIGEEIDVIITEISNNPFIIKGSIIELLKLKIYEKLKTYYHENIPIKAIVKELKPSGFLLDIDLDNVYLDAFMPTTLSGINKLTELQKEELVGKTIDVMIETLHKEKGIYVVSRRKYFQSLIPEEIKKLKKEYKKDSNTVYEGYITGTEKFGIFVEFNNCLTGMIYRYNINPEWTNDNKWKDIKPGMKINFYVKDIIENKNKIILTQILRESLWNKIKKGDVLDGEVILVKPYGALVKLDVETNGLIQSTYMVKNNLSIKTGDKIKVRILNIIRDDRKIYLGIVRK
jgi:small subunit ribosomal protein S1